MLVTKKQKLKDAIAQGDIKKALSIAKGFYLEFNEEEQRNLQIAHECFENPARKKFYAGIGTDVEKCEKQSIEILKRYK